MALIVELFGPPGSGKTTFAKALADRLRATGAEVALHLSARPGEGETRAAALDGWNRIVRPLWTIVTTKATELPDQAGEMTAPLSACLSQFGPLRRFRVRQYLKRLSALWTTAKTGPGIVIFDQAFLQLVASVLAPREQAGWPQVVELVRAVPRADVALRLDATPADLAERLDARLRQVGMIGRLLEAGAGRSEVYRRLSELLQDAYERMGLTVIEARSADDQSFDGEVERAAARIRALVSPGGRRPAHVDGLRS